MLGNSNNEEKIYQCTCGLTFGKYQNMSSHKAGCKDYLQSIGKQFEFICDQCGQAFGNYGALGTHIKFKHEQFKPKEKENVECSICGKILTKNNVKNHIKKHINNPNASFEVKERYKLDHDDLFCKFCGKECKNKNSLIQHEIRCNKNTSKKNNKDVYCGNFVCQFCGKEFKIKPTLFAHQGVCKMNQNRQQEVEKRMNSWKQTFYKNHELGMHKNLSHPHTKETKKLIGQKMSKSLKEGYASGRLKPNHGIGRGKGSYIHTTDDQMFFCRSTYEFVYALHLHYIQNKKFTIEEILVPAIRQNEYSDSFLNDFYIQEENLIVEVKGIPSDKDALLKESFESAGYNFVELFEKDINKCKKDLIEFGIDIKNLLKMVTEGADKKEYFHYCLN